MSRNQDNRDEEEADLSDIQYGFRRSRRDTSYEYRDSSSLSPLQLMDRELHYQIAEDIMVQCVLLLQMMIIIRNAHNRLRTLVGTWQRNVETNMADAVAAAQAKIRHLKEMFDKSGLELTKTK